MNDDGLAGLTISMVVGLVIVGLIVYLNLRDSPKDLDLKCIPMALSEDNTKVHIICSTRDVVFFNDTVVFNKE